MENNTINPAFKAFQSAKQVHDLISRADDVIETKSLTHKLSELKKIRIPFFLTFNEFDEILRWKLRGQYNRQYKNRERNTDANIKAITQAAFSIVHDDKDYETELRLCILTTLSGVEIPVASAILTLCFPEQYSVLDFRNWRQIFGKGKTYANYTPKEYIKYLTITRQMASNCGVTPQEIDMAIWQFDIEENR